MSWLISAIGNVLLFCLVFGMSGTVDIRCIQAQARNHKAILLGVFCQFVILPFLGYVVANFLGLDEALGLTLLVVTSSPGGSYSNWWCSMFNADLALSVTMTAISTILSMVALPANLLFYTKLTYNDDGVVENLDWNALFTALAIVMCAIVLGLTCSAKIHSVKFQRMANHLGNFAGFMLIVFSATMTNTGDSDSKIWSRHWSFYVGVSIPCLAGLIIANILATLVNLPKPERVTVAIETSYQNVGIATSLALTMFRGNDLNEAMGVPFFYGAVEALFVGIYCVGAWKMGWTKAPADASICNVLFTSYEVLEIEQGLKAVNGIEIVQSDSDSTPDKHEGNIFTTYIWWDGKSSTSPNNNDEEAATGGKSSSEKFVDESTKKQGDSDKKTTKKNRKSSLASDGTSGILTAAQDV